MACPDLTQALSRVTARRTEGWGTEALVERLNRMLTGWVGITASDRSRRRIEPWMPTCAIGCVDGCGRSTSAGDGPQGAIPTSSSTTRLGLVRLTQTTRGLPWVKA